MTEFKQERPQWCPHLNCIYKRVSQDKIYGGELPEPQPHDPGGPSVNTHRLCLKDALPNNEIFDLMVHNGKITSWMSFGTMLINQGLMGKCIKCRFGKGLMESCVTYNKLKTIADLPGIVIDMENCAEYEKLEDENN